ncbi:MAG TPA: hypothetical protein VFZ83_00695, partial [Acidimicrobiia bacterium]|nr:hypothetical protein [Acidimicrobiia bacterium]
ARVEVVAGAEAPFRIEVPTARLATRDATRHEWVPAAGPHRFMVARHAADPDAVHVDVDVGPRSDQT